MTYEPKDMPACRVSLLLLWWWAVIQVANLELVIIIILGCVLWNIVAFFTIAKRMFPNFWYVDPPTCEPSFPQMASLLALLPLSQPLPLFVPS